MSIYDKLNEPQREAVYHTDGPLLILAGAGSGKTRVLTHRIAYLIGERGVNAWNILAITFTNKAAEEMRQRVDNLVGFGAESVWVSTFHSACVRILRRFIDRLGYENHFTIYDTDDQKTLIKEVCRKVDVDTKVFKERSLLSAISSAKNEMILPDEFELNAGGDFAKMKIAKVYREYEAQMKANNALDFDDLLVKTVQLLQTQPDVLESYQERFRYIMVDEYQDTNTVQFQLVSLLAGKYKNLPILEFIGRIDQTVSIMGEKTTEVALRTAAEDTAKQLGFDMIDFTVYPDVEHVPPRYIYFMEIESLPEGMKAKEIRFFLERNLAKANPSMGDKVAKGICAPTKLNILEPETYSLYRDLMIMKGIAPAQLKPVHIIRNELQRKFFFSQTEYGVELVK